MKVILLSILCFVTGNLIAQQLPDTVFYDLGWKETARSNASYYRITIKKDNGFEVQDHYINGTLQMTGFLTSFEPENRQGTFTFYDKDGKKETVGHYFANKKSEDWTRFYNSGAVKSKEYYVNGELIDTSKTFYETGELKRIEVYKHGSIITGKCYKRNGGDTIYFPAEEMPRYKGGEDALRQFIANNVDYPKKARAKNIQGRVFIKFKVTKYGKVDEISVLKGVHPLLDRAAMDVVEKLPNFDPGKTEGVPVDVYFTVPINFTLQ